MTTIRINAASPSDQTVHLDGQDISSTVREVTVNVRAGDLPAVTLDLAVMRGMSLDGKAEVYLSNRTQNLLQAAGWTPPEGKHHGEFGIEAPKEEP